MDIEELYREYFSVVYRYVLSLSRDPALAEEVTQETFFKALRMLDGFRGQCSVRSWLCQIAKNCYLDQLKRRNRIDELPEGYAGVTASADASPETNFAQAADGRAARKALHALKEPYKEVFMLRAYGELSVAEIAELFGKSQGWVRVTYHRARMMIKEEIDNG